MRKLKIEDEADCYSFDSSYGSKPQKVQRESPEMAIAGAMADSAGYVIPSLLIHDMRVARRWMLLRADILEVNSEIIDGDECYCLRGSNFATNDTSIWVSKHDFSLRRHRHYWDANAPRSLSQKPYTLTHHKGDGRNSSI